MVGGKAAAEAGAVTHGAVRCSAWLGDVGLEFICGRRRTNSGHSCEPESPAHSPRRRGLEPEWTSAKWMLDLEHRRECQGLRCGPKGKGV